MEAPRQATRRHSGTEVPQTPSPCTPVTAVSPSEVQQAPCVSAVQWRRQHRVLVTAAPQTPHACDRGVLVLVCEQARRPPRRGRACQPCWRR